MESLLFFKDSFMFQSPDTLTALNMLRPTRCAEWERGALSQMLMQIQGQAHVQKTQPCVISSSSSSGSSSSSSSGSSSSSVGISSMNSTSSCTRSGRHECKRPSCA